MNQYRFEVSTKQEQPDGTHWAEEVQGSKEFCEGYRAAWERYVNAASNDPRETRIVAIAPAYRVILKR